VRFKPLLASLPLVLALSVAGCGDDSRDDDQARPGAAGAGDSLYPGLGNGGYQVEHYTLDIAVADVERGELTGLATLEAVATQRLSRFNLDLIGMTVDAVRVDGQLASFSRDGRELIVTPAAALAEGAPFTVEVSYRGTPERYMSLALPEPVGWTLHAGGSYVLSQPDGAATFYPVNDHPRDKASYTFRVTVPKPYQVAANGVLSETADNGDSTTYVFEARDQMASYLATIAIERFEVVTETGPNELPLRSYFPEGIDPGYRVPFANQAKIIELLNDRFGPFPFEIYGSVMVSSSDLPGALETQTLSLFGNDSFYLELPSYGELVVVHETAHQWYGDSVAVTDWRDVWINEGFATYAEWLWLEETQGVAARDEQIAETYAFVAAFPTAAPPGRPASDDLFNYISTYARPGLMLHALRLEIGDDAFFALSRTYATRYAHGNASRDHLFALVEEVSARKLDAFFDAWLYDQIVPPIPQMNLSAATAKASRPLLRDDDARIHRHGRWTTPR